MKEFIFTWRIENMSFSWHGLGNQIISPSFTASPIENSVWFLWLNPREKCTGDHLSLYLRRGQDDGPDNLSVNFELSCISAVKSVLHSHVFPKSDSSFRENHAIGHPRFMKRNEVFLQKKDLYLPRDVLTLRCRIWKNESDVDESEESFGLTRLEIERILTIEDIKLRILENTVNIYSKIQNQVLISIRILRYEDSIVVEIIPTNVQNVKFSVLKLSFVEKSNGKIHYKYTFSWLSVFQQEKWRLPVQLEPSDESEDSVDTGFELRNEFVYSTGQEIKKLETACPFSSTMSVLVSKYINSSNSGENLPDWPGISQDLWNLYVEQMFCDLELRTGTTSFLVHKFVLCARSPVIMTMLKGDMKENKDKCINIEDIPDDILAQFVRFLYTDSFENLECNAAFGLYYAADKYDVKRLKMLCCSYLLHNLVVDNVCEVLLLADKHNDSDFKRGVEDFILQNDEEIFSSSEWKKFIGEHPNLAAMTMFSKYDKEREKENAIETFNEKLSSYPAVQDDFKDLYKDEITSDIDIKTANDTIHAHKCVLGASSIQIREKLPKDLEPKVAFEIQDLDDDTVSRMLRFMYTDSLEDAQWDNVMKLYHAAENYKIQRLKLKCSCFFIENLQTSNAIDLLRFAHEHQDDRFKSVVEDFMIMHDEVFGSDDWVAFCESNFHLANQTMLSKYRK